MKEAVAFLLVVAATVANLSTTFSMDDWKASAIGSTADCTMFKTSCCDCGEPEPRAVRGVGAEIGGDCCGPAAKSGEALPPRPGDTRPPSADEFRLLSEPLCVKR